jgi:hypothetical protein
MSGNRWISVLAAAALGLGFAPAARAQLDLQWVEAPPPGDAMTKRLEDEARRVEKYDDEKHPRTASFDYVIPVDPDEYAALGANGVLLISSVVHDPKELPLKRVILRIGLKDVALQRVASRQSMLDPKSLLGAAIGIYRDDEFFLLPGSFAGHKPDLLLDFSANNAGSFHLGRLSLALADSVKPAAGTAPGSPDAATLKAVIAREYPNLVKP